LFRQANNPFENLTRSAKLDKSQKRNNYDETSKTETNLIFWGFFFFPGAKSPILTHNERKRERERERERETPDT